MNKEARATGAELAAVLEALTAHPPGVAARSASFHYVTLAPGWFQLRLTAETARRLFLALALSCGKDVKALHGRETASDSLDLGTRKPSGAA